MNFDKYQDELKCQIVDHEQRGVFGFCFNINCQKKICLKCLLTIHNSHIQDCIHFDYFEPLMKKEIMQLENLCQRLCQEEIDQNHAQSLVNYLNQKITNLKMALVQFSHQGFQDPQVRSEMFFILNSANYIKQFIIGCTQKQNEKQLMCKIEQIYENHDQSIRINELTIKGDALRELFFYQEAIQCYDKIIEMTPENVTISLCVCLHMIDQIESAMECFDFVLEIEPQNILAQKFKTELNESQQEVDCFQLPLQQQQNSHSQQVSSLMLEIINLMQQNSEQLIQICKVHKDSFWNDYKVLTFMGTALFIIQKYDECLIYIEQAIKIYPYYRKAIVVKVRALIELKQTDQANELLLKYPAKFTEKENLEIESRKLVLMGNYEEAAVTFQKLLSQSKNPIEYSMNLQTQGRLLSNQNKPNEALVFYREAEKIQPDNQCLHVEIGICLQMLKKYDEAISYCEKAISCDFTFQKAWLLKGQILLGQTLFEETLELCETYLSMCPNDKELEDLKSLAISYIGKGGGGKKYNDINPDDAAQLIYQGVELVRNKQYNEAVKIFTKVLIIKPNYIEILLAKTFCLIQLKLYIDALGIIDNNILALNQNEVQALQQKGVCLFHIKQFEEALKVFQKVQQLQPKYTEISLYCGKYDKYKLGHCLLKMGQIQEAQNIYLDDMKSSPLKYKIYAYYYVKSLFYQGQHEQAMKFINQISLQQQTVKNPQIIILQIMHLRKLNDFRNALLVTNALIPFLSNQNIDFSIIHFLKGDLLYSLNQYEQAIQAFDVLLNKRTLWIALVAKGNCLANLDQYDQADFNYNKAQENLGSVWTPEQQENALLDEIEKLEEPLKCWPKNDVKADQLSILGSLIPY